ncbi:MAG TPA: hypothetical protein VK731_00800 [Candidatus Cybelea sp.]|nr:hypothetical protein [Candidatus Cybelea sp.]
MALFPAIPAVFEQAINKQYRYENDGNGNKDAENKDGGILSNFVLPAKNVRF